MRFTIGKKIFIALTLTSVLILALNTATNRWNFQKGFLEYVSARESDILSDVAAELESVYRLDGSWEALRNDRRRWDEIFRQTGDAPGMGPPPRDQRRSRDRGAGRPPPGPGRPGGGDGRPPPDPLGVGSRITLVDGRGALVAGRPTEGSASASEPINVDGRLVGTVSIAPQQFLTQQVDQQFAGEQSRYIYLSAAASLALAAIVAGLLARQMTRPLRDLAESAQAITAGDYDTRLPDAGNDEISELARDFNLLSATLHKNRESRKQWVADIAHELRTPLSILQGELHAVEDGVREFNAQTRVSLQNEISRLIELVRDLNDLSASDEGGLSYRRDRIDLIAVLKDTLENNRTRIESAGLNLTTDLSEIPVAVIADATRVEQLVTNLIENSFRYTDTPGSLEVRTSVGQQSICVVFADSAPGVPEEALGHLFDRLYRVDPSRSRETGGSGLGLSICKAIVDAHGGNIEAAHSELGGLLIRVELPLADTLGRAHE